MTPLHWACINGHSDVVEAFIKSGAEVDSELVSYWNKHYKKIKLNDKYNLFYIIIIFLIFRYYY